MDFPNVSEPLTAALIGALATVARAPTIDAMSGSERCEKSMGG